ncbi:unnamed protein product, partial [Phaeothamnion confervicola]
VRSEAHAAGQRDVQQRWDAAERTRAELARQAEAAARVIEHEDWRRNERIKDEQIRLQSLQSTALAAARTERDGLRVDLAALAAERARDRAGSTDQQAAERADAAATLTGKLLDQCAGRREEVARAAGDLARQVIGLQAWARSALETCGPAEAPP